ncbi:MAG TPA: isoleucine--tRNA ligase [Candidatus Polarisedimenticolaceae bacterium]|nr:isoleucine--tRNA ligase [Candidatus Polarisedimenticolaceae bacterium]
MSKNVELKSTLNLPSTRFSMKANLPQKEPEILTWWDSIDLFDRIRRARAGDAPYVLHDGPPYANGKIHLGQAMNKILKDFVVKSHTMSGRNAVYVPGWDCHGLPIEHRVDKELGPRKARMTPLEIRARCRAYAEKFVAVQGDEFRRLGVVWDRRSELAERAEDRATRNSIYRTIDHAYEAEIIRQLAGFFTRGAIYHGVKPVHWCWSCRTALAEAEVEYADRTDPSIYVKFPVDGLDRRVPALAGRDVAVVIWTTTPWTLPANMAVALHPELTYVAIEVGRETLIVAEGLLGSLGATLGWDAPREVARFTGRELVGTGDDWVGHDAPVRRPYSTPTEPAGGGGVLILGEHVTLDAGTGCVHTAPGHGAEDFHVGKQYGLDVFNPVDDEGRFIPSKVTEEWLAGAFVLDANRSIVEDLDRRGLLLAAADQRHSYPHCWRCKHPVLFRSTPQWFISIDANELRRRSLEQIHSTRWIPAHGEARIAGMIESRPDWCISRQRTWGVPLPAVICSRCASRDSSPPFVNDAAFFAHVERLFLDEGSNAWFGEPDGEGGHRPYPSPGARVERLVPAGVVCPDCGGRDGLQIDEHVVDVWFESGVSHSAVLGRRDELPWPAALYLEGHDQYRGWFHSSLLVAVNDRDRAPYRGVLTHGFTLDGQGRKMSKSLGNVISPIDVAEKRGAEILRMWVSMVDFLEDLKLSDEILDRIAEAYRKVRNTFRYLLGNLSGFEPQHDAVPYERMGELDRWALQQLEQLRRKLVEAYESHQYHLVYHGLHQFCAVTLSSFYLDIIKDRLYTMPRRHPARRSALTVLHRLADSLARLMAPVLCFTAEEVWQELGTLSGVERWSGASVHTQRFPEPLPLAADQQLIERWTRFLRLREEISKALEIARQEKRIGTALEAHVVIEAGDPRVAEFLRSFGDELRFLLITSGVSFGPVGGGAFRSAVEPGLAVEVRRADGDKCQRCWNYTTDVGQDASWPGVCLRCAAHVRQIVEQADPA